MPSSLEIVRSLIQDKETPPLLSDDDINVIVALEPNAFRAAATAARSIAGLLSERVDMNAGSSALNLSKQSEKYLKLADSYDARAQQGGDGGTGISGTIVDAEPELTGTSIDEIRNLNEDDDRYGGVFRRGVTNNPPGYDESGDDYDTDYGGYY